MGADRHDGSLRAHKADVDEGLCNEASVRVIPVLSVSPAPVLAGLTQLRGTEFGRRYEVIRPAYRGKGGRVDVLESETAPGRRLIAASVAGRRGSSRLPPPGGMRPSGLKSRRSNSPRRSRTQRMGRRVVWSKPARRLNPRWRSTP